MKLIRSNTLPTPTGTPNLRVPRQPFWNLTYAGVGWPQNACACQSDEEK